MRDGNSHIDELFEVARKKPTELRLEDVDKMIAGFPLTPIPFDWSSIINLNSIIMTSVSAFIIAGSFMLYTGSAQNPASNPDNNQQEPIAQGLASYELAETTQEVEKTPMEITTESVVVPVAETPEEARPETEPIDPPALRIVEEVETIELDPESDETSIVALDVEDEIHFEQIQLPLEPDHKMEEHAQGESPISYSQDGRVEFNVSDFDGVSVSGSMDVDVKQGNSFKVWAEGKDAALEKLDIEVSNGTLHVRTKKKKDSNNKNYENYSSCDGVQVFVEMPTFDSMEIAGSGSLTIHSFSNLGGVDFSVAGSGSIDVEGELEMSGKVECSIAGSGEMNIDGTAERAEISIAGSGDFSGLDLKVRSAEISIAGSGDVGIHAEENLEVSVAGSGDVEYIGDPKIEKSIMGSGDIRRH